MDAAVLRSIVVAAAVLASHLSSPSKHPHSFPSPVHSLDCPACTLTCICPASNCTSPFTEVADSTAKETLIAFGAGALVLGFGFILGWVLATCRGHKETVVKGTVQGREPCAAAVVGRPAVSLVGGGVASQASVAAAVSVKDEVIDVEAEALAQLALVRSRR